MPTDGAGGGISLKKFYLPFLFFVITLCAAGFTACAQSQDTKEDGGKVEPHSHILVYEDGVSPTCTESGIAGYNICEGCGKFFSAQTGEEIEQPETLPALGHSYSRLVPRVEPTCTAEGTEAYYECERCGALFSGETGEEISEDELIIPELGHIWQFSRVLSPATCVSPEMDEYVCLRNGEHTMTKELNSLLRHSYDQGVCTMCGKPESEGLEYTLQGDCYVVSGMGTCTDIRLHIPYTYNGRPVVGIADEAFLGNTSIISVTLPDTVRSIGYYAFSDCTSLRDIDFGEGLIEIDGLAFVGSSITRVDLPDSLTIVDGFYGCEELESVSFGRNVVEILSSAFEYCNSLEYIDIPSSVYSVGGFAFAHCANLREVDFSGSEIESLENFMFYESPSLESVDLSGTSIEYIGNSAFYTCSSLSQVLLPDTLEGIDVQAFYNCSSLKSIDLPASLRYINAVAFSGAGLTSVAIPAATVSINKNAFSRCPELVEFNVEEGNPVYHSDGNCLINTAEKMIVLGCEGSVIPRDESVIGIYSWAFDGISNLTELYISEHMTDIDIFAFVYCGNIQKIEVAEGNTVYCTINNMLVLRESKYVIRACADSVIPSDGSILGLCDGAFTGCAVKNVYIPACIKFVGPNSFDDCTQIESITVEEGNEHYYGAGNCLMERDASGETTLIKGCDNSYVAEGVDIIRHEAFKDCDFKSITIASTVKEISSFAFQDCTQLTEIIFEGTVEEWNAVEKGDGWDINTGEYVVRCVDGIVEKSAA